jgi:hypothetical protein
MHFTKTGIALAAFLAGCGASAAAVAIPKARAGTNPARWEYRCVQEMGNPTGALNLHGAEGWELTAVSGAMWCFKRQLP